MQNLHTERMPHLNFKEVAFSPAKGHLTSYNSDGEPMTELQSRELQGKGGKQDHLYSFVYVLHTLRAQFIARHNLRHRELLFHMKFN